ncbi:hypothetical protein HVA01_28480 [Halovibrio variabilis]|uniref:Uncharacterized protein n=1 Tax=Halovibrio variabilis TaxID=31910 RepID=A0A511UVM8_9GAMM|nr:hypothetical protein [Halovibrio variabilis]GEN29202.1 hypothetical protein HVA01_28480 [Halovibrio variabilis]
MGAVPAVRLFSIIVKGRPSFYDVETPLQRPGAEIDEGEKLGIEKTARNLFKLGGLVMSKLLKQPAWR